MLFRSDASDSKKVFQVLAEKCDAGASREDKKKRKEKSERNETKRKENAAVLEKWLLRSKS